MTVTHSIYALHCNMGKKSSCMLDCNFATWHITGLSNSHIDNVFTDSVTQMATLGIFFRPALPIITENHAKLVLNFVCGS